MEYLAKMFVLPIGWVVQYAALLYDAFRLSGEEKELLKKYDGTASHAITKENGGKSADALIKVGAIAMSTTNRALFTTKGERLKRVIEFFRM